MWSRSYTYWVLHSHTVISRMDWIPFLLQYHCIFISPTTLHHLFTYLPRRWVGDSCNACRHCWALLSVTSAGLFHCSTTHSPACCSVRSAISSGHFLIVPANNSHLPSPPPPPTCLPHLWVGVGMGFGFRFTCLPAPATHTTTHDSLLLWVQHKHGVPFLFGVCIG